MLIKFVKLTLAISLTTCSTTPDPMAGIQALLDAADFAASTLALPCSPAVVAPRVRPLAEGDHNQARREFVCS